MDANTIERLLAAQGIELAPGRAERLAPGVNALNVKDPVGDALPFEADPTTYVVIRERLK
ncbi:MAG TPA: hypothetical protein VM183_03975 [Burkholderiales bacterium]|nr:hypothetical protein [Burkholderiales bacterium]